MSRKQRKKKKHFAKNLFRLILIVIVGFVLFKGAHNIKNYFKPLLPKNNLEHFAKSHDIDLSDYPEGLIALYEKNPEAKDFVFEYPLKKNEEFEIDLSQYKDCDTVPLFIQWDQRWGYSPYAGSIMGLSGCGPTCLSMAAVYLTKDTSLDPKTIAKFASKNGYESNGSGTAWKLFSEGAKKLGLKSTEIPLDKSRIIENLKAENPIVCVVGPGDFTAKGHFIVMTGYENGKIKINDPNSYQNSKKLWDLDRISSQIKNLWVLRAK